jgi:hypothetical protein
MRRVVDGAVVAWYRSSEATKNRVWLKLAVLLGVTGAALLAVQVSKAQTSAGDFIQVGTITHTVQPSDMQPRETVQRAPSTIEATQVAVGTTSAGLVIVPTFDSTITNDPNAASIEAAINTAINNITSQFSDPITVNILFAEQTTGLGSSSSALSTVSYATFLTALKGDAKTSDDATAMALLPNVSTNPVNGSTSINIKAANLRAVGINVNPGQDGRIWVNTTITSPGSPGSTSVYNLVPVIEHEIDEVLGLGSALPSVPQNTILPEDLYRYSAVNTRTFTTTDSRISGVFAYFSIDAKNALAEFDNQNDGGDFGDWQSKPRRTGVAAKVQDAFATPGANPSMSVELTALDVIGYDRVAPSVPPSIVSQPASQTIISGSTATLSVTATGTAPLTYQWYVGTSGSTNSPVSGATSSSYTTPPLASTTSYWVQVSNPAGTASSTTATISVAAITAPPTPPFGMVDTPVNGVTGVTGSIAVTGWALASPGVATVKIYRNCLSGIDNAACQAVDGNSVVFIGDAVFITGARPDIEALYPAYPFANRAGWGYLMLTNVLPHVTAPASGTGGQGPLTLFAFATDLQGNRALLGQRSITLDNDDGAKPFGGIDTPTQGGTASGIVQNYGWALTPGSAIIPTNGSTMTVVVDGVALGTVTYNLCRDGASPPAGPGQCHDDIATLFPTFTNITRATGAIGVFNLDTTKLGNGVHTIAWGVSDTQGRTDGLGSRYFTVQNGSGLVNSGSRSSSVSSTNNAEVVGSAMDVVWFAPSTGEVTGQAGFNFDAPMEVIDADATGVRSVRIPELGRIELQLGSGTSVGYLNANGTLRPLPPGSQLNTATGQFTWVPGPGYVGTYDLVFVQGSSQVPVEVRIEPKSTITAGLMRGWIDTPSSSSSVNASFMVAGWALDGAAWHGAGVGAVHVWAQRRDGVGAAPVFLGPASLGSSRPDVASAFGKQFDRAGWILEASGLPAGVYDVTAYFWSNRKGQFDDARTVTVSVR